MKEDKNLSSKKERNDIIRLSENDLDNNYEDVKEVKTTSEKKKKKKGGEASKNSDSIYSFEKLFKYPDKYNYETLKTVDAITADREDSDDSDNDNESDSQSSSMSEKRKNIEKHIRMVGERMEKEKK